MSQGSVSKFAAMFDQQPLIKTAPAPKPKPKPPVPTKSSDTNNGNANHVNGVNSTAQKKRFTPPPGSIVGIPHNKVELSQVKLKRAPPPKKPPSSNDSSNESPFPRRPSVNKPKPNITAKPVPGVKPLKPKPAVVPRKPSSVSSTQSHESPPTSPTPSYSKSDLDDSTSRSSSFSDSSLPRTSTTESNTSRTESSTSRRTSGKPEMQILPPADILGAAPPKPKKPMISVVLPSPTPSVNIKSSSKRSSFLYKQQQRNSSSSTGPGTPTSVRSNAAPSEGDDAETDEFYDDVAARDEGPALPRRPAQQRPPSMIPTLDSDEENAGGGEELIPTMDSDEENDDVYDDTALPLLNFSFLPPVPGTMPGSIPHIPFLCHNPLLFDAAPPPVPDIGRLPQSLPPQLPPSRSPLLPRSPIASTPENSGGDADFDMTYDDVSNPSDGEQEELYEAVESDLKEELQRNADQISIVSSTTDENQDVSAKELEAQRKRDEKQRRELEKQQKKEEERRKKEEEKKEKERQKKEREEKKKREKEEKDAKKKFNVKGDIVVLEKRTIVVDCQPEYADKLDLMASKGDELEILRKEGNPDGKWLARDTEGRYGYIPETCVEVEDLQEVYDDVSVEDGEDEEIYDVPDAT